MIPWPMHTTIQCHACLEGVHVELLGFLSSVNRIFMWHSTHKIVGISTISRAAPATAQMRELACTKDVLPQVIDRGEFSCLCQISCELSMCDINIGLHVVDDIQAQVAKCIRETLGLVNSYDTWHGIFVLMFIMLMHRNKECG